LTELLVTEADQAARGTPNSPAALGLTGRQEEVLALMMQGKSNKAICRAVKLAEPTVKYHVAAILKALQVANRTEAVLAVGRLGWTLPAAAVRHSELPVPHRPSSSPDKPSTAARVSLDAPARSGAAEPQMPALPDKPSIAVMPFANLSADADQDYFADGMAEEIITALSRCKSLFVIARNSSFAYKGQAVDVRKAGRELGVRYVLEGSVRRGGRRLRFMTQLIDATSGKQIWADRFEGGIGDVFALQDRITESVAAVIEPNVQLAEIERSQRTPATNLDAYDLLLRAQRREFEFTPESLAEAVALLDRALAIAPSFAAAMALAAHCYCWRRHQGWATNPEREAKAALHLAARAVEFGKADANVLWMSAFVALAVGMDAQRAKQLAYGSLALNPNSAAALAVAAIVESNLADQDKALELFARAERLNPRDPRGWAYAGSIAVAYFVHGQPDQAAAIAQAALLQNSRHAVALRALAASFAATGQREAAAAALRELLKIDPTLTISRLRARLMFMHETVWRTYADGLRLAGLRE
jgi:TolB-like protein/DNA-binding CsgD family transcriptional regulator